MSDKIKVMLVDGNQTVRNDLRKILAFDSDMEVICEAASGEEAVRKVKIMGPDIVLVNIKVPGIDGLAVTEAIVADMPQCLVVMFGEQWGQEYFRKAIYAGAKDYLVKPLATSELLTCIRNLYKLEEQRREKFSHSAKANRTGKVTTIFSSKGGIGKTTIAANLGTALGRNKDNRVAIVDMDLQFGDVALFLNVTPKRTIADLANTMHALEQMDDRVLDSYMTKYKENINVLAAPLHPEQAERVTISYLPDIMKVLKQNYDYIIIDTAPLFNEITFNILDLSDMIFVATSQDLPTLKNVKLCLEVLQSLHYPEVKVKVLLNRANSFGGLDIKDSEVLLQTKFLASIPSDGNIVVTSVNQGTPFVSSSPDTEVAQAIFNLASYVIYGDSEQYRQSVAKKSAPKSLISKVSGFFK